MTTAWTWEFTWNSPYFLFTSCFCGATTSRPRAPRPHGDGAAPARLLPRFDNLVLSHDDRRRVIADEHRSAVVQGAEVTATFLVDGFVAGLWSFAGSRVRLEPFAPLPRAARRELAEESARLEAFVRAAGSSH